MKKPWLAFLLNFLLAGLGFAYLGKWKWAALNFFGIILAAVFLLRFIPSDYSSAVSAGVAAMNGAIAMQVANAMNAQADQALKAALAGTSEPAK